MFRGLHFLKYKKLFSCYLFLKYKKSFLLRKYKKFFLGFLGMSYFIFDLGLKIAGFHFWNIRNSFRGGFFCFLVVGPRKFFRFSVSWNRNNFFGVFFSWNIREYKKFINSRASKFSFAKYKDFFFFWCFLFLEN